MIDDDDNIILMIMINDDDTDDIYDKHCTMEPIRIYLKVFSIDRIF